MAMEGGPTSSGPNLHALGLLDGNKGGGGGATEQKDPLDMLKEAINTAVGKYGKAFTTVDMTLAGQQAPSPISAYDTQGLPAKNIPGLLTMVDSPGGSGNPILAAGKLLLSNRAVSNQAEGVGGDHRGEGTGALLASNDADHGKGDAHGGHGLPKNISTDNNGMGF
jgi:hypothetical protein